MGPEDGGDCKRKRWGELAGRAGRKRWSGKLVKAVDGRI